VAALYQVPAIVAQGRGMKALLDLARTTADGRFRVTIESFPPGDLVLTEDAARSLIELSDILTEAAAVTVQLALRLLLPTDLRLTVIDDTTPSGGDPGCG
jgi:hypothetical protein